MGFQGHSGEEAWEDGFFFFTCRCPYLLRSAAVLSSQTELDGDNVVSYYFVEPQLYFVERVV